MLNAVGGRKVASALVMLVVAGAIVIIKGDIPANMVSFLEFLFGALVAGNAVEHVTGAVKARADAAADNTDDTKPIPDHKPELQALTDSVTSLSANDTVLAQNIGIVQQTLSLIIRKLQIDKMPDPQ